VRADRPLLEFLDFLIASDEHRKTFISNPDLSMKPYELDKCEQETLRLLADDVYGLSDRGLRNLVKMLRGLDAFVQAGTLDEDINP
jgi:hypothetical protein